VKKLENYDLIILLMAVALTCFGVVMVYSASSIMAAKKYHDSFYFLKRQGIYAVLGFTGMLVRLYESYPVATDVGHLPVSINRGA